MGESPNPEWSNPWQALARQYAAAWQELARGAAGTAAGAGTPWPQGLEQWSRLFASGSGPQGETLERMIDSAKSYGAFLQAALAAVGKPADAGAKSWADAFARGFPEDAATAAFTHPLVQAWQHLAQQRADGFAPFVGLFNAMRQPGTASEEAKSWLSLPAFGLLREHQEHYQKSAVAWIDYQEQMKRYNALMLKAAQRGFELFEGKLAEREQPGRQIDSLRALYDLWVDAAEEGYAEIALSIDFREAYAALVNAQMRVRSQVQQELERVATDLGMPTRSELNSIGERLQALRREVRNGAQQGDAGLGADLAALRDEVASIRGRLERARPDASAAADSRQDRPDPQRRSKSGKAGKSRAAAEPTGKSSKGSGKRKRKAKRKSAAKAERAVAATASGNFASRIARFADASLGTRRARPAPTGNKAGKPRKAKPRRHASEQEA